jgi:hypothetical protein
VRKIFFVVSCLDFGILKECTIASVLINIPQKKELEHINRSRREQTKSDSTYFPNSTVYRRNVFYKGKREPLILLGIDRCPILID